MPPSGPPEPEEPAADKDAQGDYISPEEAKELIKSYFELEKKVQEMEQKDSLERSLFTEKRKVPQTWTHLFVCAVFVVVYVFVALGSLAASNIEYYEDQLEPNITYHVMFEGRLPEDFTRLTKHLLDKKHLKPLMMVELAFKIVPLVIIVAARNSTLSALIGLADLGGFRFALHWLHWSAEEAAEDVHFMFACTVLCFLVIQTDSSFKQISQKTKFGWMVIAYVMGFLACIGCIYVLNLRFSSATSEKGGRRGPPRFTKLEPPKTAKRPKKPVIDSGSFDDFDEF